MPLRILWVAARTQLRIARRNIENVYPLLTIPLQSLISLAIIVHSGRPDLAHYSLVASLLMTVGQMSFFDASEILAQDRNQQIPRTCRCVPHRIRPAAHRTHSGVDVDGHCRFCRILVDGSFHIRNPHDDLSSRHLRNHADLHGVGWSRDGTHHDSRLLSDPNDKDLPECHQWPALLLSGALVPVSFLPAVLRPLSRLLYLFWSADLLRESMQPADPVSTLPRLAAILILGLSGGALGTWLLRTMLNNLRREGTLGFS
jgi:ABC-2 type transport system permease protein